MQFTSGFARAGVLAVALGIGALPAAPWLATAADTGPSAQDIDVWLASANIDISIWGLDVWQQGNAHAASVPGDMAIAIGDGSTAQAGSDVTLGVGDFAFASGDDSTALALGNFSSATANGADSTATANGLFDSAGVSGTDSTAWANIGNGDIAQVFGNNSTALAGGAGDTVGNSDYAGAFGDNLTADATGGSNLFVVEPSDSTTAAITAATTSDDFGLADLLNDLGLGGLVPGLDEFLAWW